MAFSRWADAKLFRDSSDADVDDDDDDARGGILLLGISRPDPNFAFFGSVCF